jgi:hypothetical protein
VLIDELKELILKNNLAVQLKEIEARYQNLASQGSMGSPLKKNEEEKKMQSPR